MIELTPLDVRKKLADFSKGLRGYDPQEVDVFLESVAERMEVLVKENLAFRQEIDRLGEKVVVMEGREQAVQEALVTAQELRQDVKKQASREAKLLEREARGRIEGMMAESERRLTEHRAALQELERQRDRFLKAFRTLLERELDTVEVEFGRAPLEDVTVDLELGRTIWSVRVDTDDREEENDEDEDQGEDDQGDDGDRDHHDKRQAGARMAEATELSVAGDDAPAAGLDSPEAKYEVTEGDDPRPPERRGGVDSSWLSSILKDRKDEDVE